ncbi:MAG: hypothetical protein ACI85U_004007, partial [Candidatus Promineifilaceae bacterium]
GFTLHWTIVALMNLKQITGRINQQLWLLILSTNCSIGRFVEISLKNGSWAREIDYKLRTDVNKLN